MINTVDNDVELGSNGMSSNLGKKVVNDVVAPYIEMNTVGAVSSNATNKVGADTKSNFVSSGCIVVSAKVDNSVNATNKLKLWTEI
nr:hypothetical protein [Tanacetum cinerariifolium]